MCVCGMVSFHSAAYLDFILYVCIRKDNLYRKLLIFLYYYDLLSGISISVYWIIIIFFCL